MLARDEAKHIRCKYEGHEFDCPKSCDKCAISIKTEGDIALAKNELNKAIKQYKRAVFIEPKFAEAWVNMGNAYGMKSEYNNAISSFNKAIAVDPTYGKALFGKAITLKNQGKFEEAMLIADEILEMYDDSEVMGFKDTLTKLGVKGHRESYSLEKAIDLITDKAYDVILNNELLDANGEISSEKGIYDKEEFARAVYSFCKKRYIALGNEKVWSESILASFFGSLCTTLLYYKDASGFRDVTPFAYLSDHVDLEELDRNAEKLLDIRQIKSESERLWNLIYGFVSFCNSTIGKIELTNEIEAAVIDASESAYVMGMLYAMRSNEKTQKDSQHSSVPDSVLNQLERLHKEIDELSPLMGFGYGNQEIIDASKGSGYTPQQYREHLHITFYQKQREYNRIIDQYNLSNVKPKYTIDSFGDTSGELSLLDPVEVDLKKRMASSSLFSRCRLLTENDTYRFYSCDFSMLREEIKSGNVVYFGHSGSPACIYHDNLYWYDYGSILSDKYIARCNIEDGLQQKKYDWLSNEKTGEAIGHSFHIVSEDSVTEMRVENDNLIILVKRKSIENAKYMIKVEEIGNSIRLSKHILSGDFSSCKDISSFK